MVQRGKQTRLGAKFKANETVNLLASALSQVGQPAPMTVQSDSKTLAEFTAKPGAALMAGRAPFVSRRRNPAVQYEDECQHSETERVPRPIQCVFQYETQRLNMFKH